MISSLVGLSFITARHEDVKTAHELHQFAIDFAIDIVRVELLLKLDWTGLDQGLDNQPPISVTAFSALSPHTWPFSLEWLPRTAYLVGGSVRDGLLGRHSDYLDLDFVLPTGVVETARTIARHYQAGFVLLDAERQIARVVFPQGTVDFAQQVGDSLEADLHRRDFTVNAIAYNPHTAEFIDPLNGCIDLEKRLIRMVSAENLQEDPLRLLRAYRQSAQLNFYLDPATATAIHQFAPLLQRIAAERIQSELNYLLSAPGGTVWLTRAWQNDLLKSWLPDATIASFELLARMDQTVIWLQEVMPEFVVALLDRIRIPTRSGQSHAIDIPKSSSGTKPLNVLESGASGSARNWLMTAKFACLLPSLPITAEAQLRSLKYSRTEIQAVSTVLKALPQLCTAAHRTNAEATEATSGIPINLSLREQYFLFQSVGAAFPALAVFAIAQGIALEAISPLIQRFLVPEDPVAHPIPLLTGQDLMTTLHLPAGPQIGQLLAAVQLARAEGLINTPAEAIEFARNLLTST
ncbi:CCA tRNA nucleotidyltransferase [Pantanalinema rosaneae CENA516]|uniref:CCA tRNA nucleotidyltransferase n=1 Tax=Pantanalinema rosaneae TaxID=1620701 RepID=UPI003D6FAF9E